MAMNGDMVTSFCGMETIIKLGLGVNWKDQISRLRYESDYRKRRSAKFEGSAKEENLMLLGRNTKRKKT